MTWVEIPAPADLVLNRGGRVQRGATADLELVGTSTDATHAADTTGASPTTGGLHVREDGTIGTAAGRRYVQSGTPLELTIAGRTRLVQPVAASVESGIKSQSAEGTVVPVFTVVPKTAGSAPFQFQMNSFANDGAGAGTFNHLAIFGFNASLYSGGEGETVAPGMYMGFEDNFHDTAGADSGEEKYGPEWYVGYTTPDGTTIGPAGLRPFYCRVKGGRTNTAATAKSVQAWVDIGGGATGFFGIFHGQVAGNTIAVLNKDTITANKPLVCANPGVGLQIIPSDTGQVYAQLQVEAPTAGGFPVLHFKTGGVSRWSFVAARDEVYLEDFANASRKHIQFLPGASDTAASTVLKSSFKLMGNVGFYGATPGTKPAISGSRGGNAALANLLTALAGLGLVTDSTTA